MGSCGLEEKFCTRVLIFDCGYGFIIQKLSKQVVYIRRVRPSRTKTLKNQRPHRTNHRNKKILTILHKQILLKSSMSTKMNPNRHPMMIGSSSQTRSTLRTARRTVVLFVFIVGFFALTRRVRCLIVMRSILPRRFFIFVNHILNKFFIHH